MTQKSTPDDNQDPTRIYLLPNLFTAGNLFFGFLAIIRCIQAKYAAETASLSQTFYTQAVWLIFAAGMCDVLDGLIARLGGRESPFGKEFDSIADAVSFGVAPALMVFFLILSPSEGYPFFRQVGWFIGFIYLLCAGVRLARFNVLSHPYIKEEQRSQNISGFQGLPTTAAGGTIASLVLVLSQFDLNQWSLVLPWLMLLIAWLMVSSVPFPSLKSINWDTQARPRNFIVIVIFAFMAFHLGELVFACIAFTYIFYGLFRHWASFFRKKN